MRPASFPSAEILNQYAVLTVTPDLIAQQLVPNLLQRLASEQVRPVAAIPHVFSLAEPALLYRGVVTHKTNESRVHAGWLTPRLFMGGAALVLILRARTGTPPLQERICMWKGRSRFGEPAEEQLRGLSPVVDRNLSLMHSPDDYDGFMHELDILVGQRAISSALDSTRPELDPGLVAGLFLEEGASSLAHIFDILFVIVSRAISLLACDPGRSLDPGAALQFSAEITSMRRRLSGLPRDTNMDAAVWSAMAEVGQWLGDVLPAEIAAFSWYGDIPGVRRGSAMIELIRMLIASCERRRFGPSLSFQLVECMRRSGLLLPYWQEHMLHVVGAHHAGE